MTTGLPVTPSAGGASSQLEETIRKLEAYCRTRNWIGFDPYDALNSELFARTPLTRSRVARLAFTQFMKRSPVNVRTLFRVRPRHDPKALALFVTYYVRRARLGDDDSRATARSLVSRLLEHRSPQTPSYWCWGYSFPWQTRDRLVPRFSPNLVCTTFAANALLDAYEAGFGNELLPAAVSAGEYIANELYWSSGQQTAFAYPLADIRVPIHNANFLGAALLCRLARITGELAYLPEALGVTRYSVHGQRGDGSWPYGLGATQQWIDNFHTGYNLCALKSIGASLDTDEFDPAVERGFGFYREHFFTPRGAPRYFHDQTYPIDIHCVAQSILTLLALRNAAPGSDELLRAVVSWAIDNMWDDRGFFYYRRLRAGTIRVSYLRWSQAWMLLALSTLRSPSYPCTPW